jgi:hypothetical protein
MPLLRLFPGRPRRIFSCLTSFFGGIFFFLVANVRVKIQEKGENEGEREEVEVKTKSVGRLPAARCCVAWSPRPSEQTLNLDVTRDNEAGAARMEGQGGQ